MIDYFSLGQIIADDLLLPYTPIQRNMLGGCAYAIFGMRLWSPRVGMCSGLGMDFDAMHGEWFRANGIDLSGGLYTAEKSAHSEIRYFEDGEREEISLPGCATLAEMMPNPTDIPACYENAKGMYFYTDTDEHYWAQLLAFLRLHPMQTVWELHPAATQAKCRERVIRLGREVTAISLNLSEGRRLCERKESMDIIRMLLDAGVHNVLLHMGELGALAGNHTSIYHIPAVPTEVVDVTGGGNASTGGFLAGLCDGDIARAGKCAAVSASFVLEQYGAPPAVTDATLAEAQRRFDSLMVTEMHAVTP